MTAAAKAKSGTHWRRIIALTLFAGLMLAALALANSGRAAIETPPPPSVWSDKADYAPGEQVALSGANWAPGESVHIRVNDDAGETWRRDVDVTADESGAISDQFNLPDWFVAQYSVTATGASSGTATWSFTDGNVTLHLEAAQGVANMTVTYDRWNGTSSSPNSTCSGPPTNTNLTVTIPTASGTVNITGFGGNTDSVRLKSVTTTTTTKTFDRWTSAVGTTGSAKNTDSGVDVPGTPTPCISNDNGGSSGNLTDAFAHFKNANAAPVCTNGSATTPEDTAVAANLNCTDADGNPLTYTIVSGPTSGVLSGSGASRTYTPNANFNGTDSFTFKANDGTVDSNVATFNLTITEVNDAPTAVADSKSVAEDGVLTLRCLNVDDERFSAGPANESGQTLTVTAVSSTASTHGSVSLSAGTVTYTPDADFNGAASFSYTVQDNGTTNGAADPKTATGTVNVTVTEVNDAPDAVDDSASVAEDGNTLVDVLGNDSTGPANESGQALTISAVGTPAHGTAVVQSGKVKYTPNADYNGSDSFTYTATDNGTTNGANDFKSDTATVSVTVTEVNDDPTAVADSEVRSPRTARSQLPGERPDGQRLGRPGERVRTDPDRDLRRSDHGSDARLRLARRRHHHLHAGSGLQRPGEVRLHGAGQRHDRRRSGLQDRNRLCQRHRHRGQRRPHGHRRLEDRRRGRHALLPGERPDGQRLGRPGERKRPDADGYGCG